MAKNREPVKEPESDLSDESDSEESDSDSEPAQILVKKPPASTVNKSPYLKSPPPAQSSSEEEEDDSESEEEVPALKTMAPKPIETPQKPEEEEEEEEEEEDDTDSDSEVPELKTVASKPIETPQKPEEEEEEEEDDDSDSDSEVPDPNVKSKSIETPQKPIKISQPKPVASEPAAASKSTSKRPAEEKELDEGKDSKKSKKNPQNELGAASDSSKRVLFQRIWSEEDEIVILKGMINYFAKKKSKPTADLGAFLEYIKKDLHIEVKKEQLQAKIQKLKRRYETNKIKGRNFTKPHEKELFDLSENYWGTGNGKDIVASPKANGGSVVKKMAIKKAKIVENEEDDDDTMSEEIANNDLNEKGLAPTRCSNGLTVDERILRIGAELFEGVNGVEGYKEWKNLTIEEFEIHVRRLDLMRTRSELVLDYLKSKNH